MPDPRPASAARRAVDRVCDACLLVAKLAVAAMALLIVADVLLRMAFRMPVPGAYELVGMLGALAVAGALPHVQRSKAFIVVETLTERFAPPTRRRLGRLTLAIEAAFFLVLAVQFLVATRALVVSGQVSDILHLPQWGIYAAVSAGCLAVFAVTLQQLLERAEVVQ